MQADVEVSFEANEFGKAEVLDHWVKPQLLCSNKGAAVRGGLGPFGLLAFASKDLEEYTAVFFRVFIYQRKPLVLFCSDQSRFNSMLIILLISHNLNVCYHLLIFFYLHECILMTGLQ